MNHNAFHMLIVWAIIGAIALAISIGAAIISNPKDEDIDYD